MATTDQVNFETLLGSVAQTQVDEYSAAGDEVNFGTVQQMPDVVVPEEPKNEQDEDEDD